MGELYAYLPPTAQNKAAMLAIQGTRVVGNNDDVFSVGRGAWKFPTGKWVTVSEYVKMNDPPSAHNGRVTVYIDGEEKIDLNHVALATREGATFQGITFSTFFGGTSTNN